MFLGSIFFVEPPKHTRTYTHFLPFLCQWMATVFNSIVPVRGLENMILPSDIHFSSNSRSQDVRDGSEVVRNQTVCGYIPVPLSPFVIFEMFLIYLDLEIFTYGMQF